VWKDCTIPQVASSAPATNIVFSFCHSHRQYADESLGFMIVRGENVAMMGLMGAVSRPPEIAGYKRVTVAEIKPVSACDCIRLMLLSTQTVDFIFILIIYPAHFCGRSPS
jgi:hypothetical protein